MKLLLIYSFFITSALAQTVKIDEKEIKLQIGSEAIIEHYMELNKVDDLDVIFRCKKNKTKKIKCFVIDKKILK